MGAAALSLGVVVPSFAVRVRDVEADLETVTGCSVGVAAAHWDLGNLWPELAARSLVARRTVWPGLELTVAAREIRVETGENGAFRLEGVRLDLGPLQLREGTLLLEPGAQGLRVEGGASGDGRGWLDVSGTLEPRTHDAPPLRLYLDRVPLRLPLPEALDPEHAGGIDLEVSGQVTLAHTGAESADLDLDLEAVATRAWTAARGSPARGERFRGTLRGRLSQRAGRLYAERPLVFEAQLAEVSGGARPRVISGPLRVELTPAGSLHSARLGVRADLTDLRVRVGDHVLKQAGRSARLHSRLRWSGESGAVDVRGELALPDLSLRWARSGADRDGAWRVASSWVPLEVLRQHAPLLARHAPELAGQARLRGALGRRLEIELRELDGRVRATALRAPALSLALEPDGLSFVADELALAGQSLALEGRARWAEPGPVRVELESRAARLDLAALGDAFLALAGDDPAPGPGPERWRELGGEALAREVAQLLHRRAEWFDVVQVDRAVLRVERLLGPGVDERDAEVALALRARELRLEIPDLARGGAAESYVVDLRGWKPELLESARPNALHPPAK